MEHNTSIYADPNPYAHLTSGDVSLDIATAEYSIHVHDICISMR